MRRKPTARFSSNANRKDTSMKLQHYIGGLENVGPVLFERKVFVEQWETRIFGIHVAMMALSSQLPLPATPSGFHTVWTWADLRKGAESLSPFDYFKYRYYEKWLGGISGYMVQNGYITEAELETRTQQILVNPAAARKTGGDPAIDKRINTYLVEGDSPRRPLEKPAAFKEGDQVYVKNPPTIEHTRLPGYLRNRTGVIYTVYPGAYTYLTSTGQDGIGPAMPVYCVAFDPETIWEGNTDKNMVIYADLFEAYLEKPPEFPT
jgi:nitrile hydratase beta subunit